LVAAISSQRNKTNGNIPIIIYGAGYSGYQLSLGLQSGPQEYKIVAFVDDNYKLINSKLRGINVYRSSKLEELANTHKVSTVLLAMGNVSRSQKSLIIRRLEQLHLKTLTIPNVQDIVSGKASISDIKPVAVEDLLGRDQVPPKPELMGAFISNKHVMVTGAGGSIGSELCRKIVQQSPKKLILFDLSEYNLYAIEHELNKLNANHAVQVIAILGTVQNKDHLEEVMSAFAIDTIYHAAAYKHVPLVEHNIIEGVNNNILGTWRCAEAAIKSNVSSFILVSTDKAVRPTNIMGTTKRVAELVLQALTERQTKTRFTMVRFGNVLGSSGSVVPLFRKQIAAGGPLTVTHPDITRYFMTIPEAAELVIQAGAMGKGGDVFVLDMGEPVRIVDLAKQMIHLSGLESKNDNQAHGDVEIQFTGLRPGEKLYEELLVGDNATGTEHQLIMRAEEKYLAWEETNTLLKQLEKYCNTRDHVKIHKILLGTPTDYQGNKEIRDHIWKHTTTPPTPNLITLSSHTTK